MAPAMISMRGICRLRCLPKKKVEDQAEDQTYAHHDEGDLVVTKGAPGGPLIGHIIDGEFDASQILEDRDAAIGIPIEVRVDMVDVGRNIPFGQLIGD